MSDQDAFARILASLYQATLDDRHWPVTFALIEALVHDSKLTVNDPNPAASHRPRLYDSGQPRSGIWFRT